MRLHLAKKTLNQTVEGQQAGARPLTPSPRKAVHVSNVRQVSWLAAFAYSLHLPEAVNPQWCWQISFRLQLRGSNGFAPSSLATAHGCNTT